MATEVNQALAAYAGGLEPLLCLTKTDLASPQPLLDRYAGLGLDAVAISRELPLDELRSASELAARAELSRPGADGRAGVSSCLVCTNGVPR